MYSAFMNVTLKDIAKNVGLTTQAVSQALRGYPNISQETAVQVREVAKKMGYRPNLGARNLRARRSQTIGFIFPDISYDYSQKIVEGARSIFASKGYIAMIGLSSWDREQESCEIDVMLGYKVEALVCQPIVESAKTYQRLAESGLPFVFVGNGLDIPNTSWVGVDDYGCARQVVEHLVFQGHKKIAVVTPNTSPVSMSLMPRIHAYRDVLESHGISFDKEYLGYTKIGEESSVEDVVMRLMSLEQRPTAIFAVSDSLGYSVMNSLRRNKYKIPEDVAVAGIGDLAPSGFDMISLTTVSIDPFRQGQVVAEKVLSLISQKGQNVNHEHVMLKGDLVIRQSTVKK